MSRLRLIAFSLGGCAYAPGSFSNPQVSSLNPAAPTFEGQRTTVGCLDVAVTLVARSPHEPVVRYVVGNRCDRATTVDLSAVRVRSAVGVSLEGKLRPYDPRRELRPLQMEARTVISEQIEYRAIGSNVDGSLCVDVGNLNGPSNAERWLCQEAREGEGAP